MWHQCGRSIAGSQPGTHRAKLAKPVEMPCLRCNTQLRHARARAHQAGQAGRDAVSPLEHSHSRRIAEKIITSALQEQ